jgi:hypothetical protein
MRNLKVLPDVAYFVRATSIGGSRHTFLVFNDHIFDPANTGPVRNVHNNRDWIRTVNTVTPVRISECVDVAFSYLVSRVLNRIRHPRLFI